MTFAIALLIVALGMIYSVINFIYGKIKYVQKRLA